MPDYEVENNIPLPAQRTRWSFLSGLQVGESILFPVEKRKSVQTMTSTLKKDTGKEFTVRKVDIKNVRVWRTK